MAKTPPDKEITPEDAARLAAAIVTRATLDAVCGEMAAVLWLASPDCKAMCYLAGVDSTRAESLGYRLFSSQDYPAASGDREAMRRLREMSGNG